MKILLTIFLLIPSLLLSEVQLKQPGTKYSDTRKQNTADEASRNGQVIPKQSGTKYSDTRKQSENNQRVSDGQIMNKIPGQKFSDTRSGTAKSINFNNEIGQVQSQQLKNKLKKKFNIKTNADNGIIDPLSGQIITLKSIDKMVSDNHMEIPDMFASYSHEEIKKMFLDNQRTLFKQICENKELQEVKELMDLVPSEDVINSNLFVLNYIIRGHGLVISRSDYPELCW